MSSKSDRDNRSNQMNPNNSAYESSRSGSSSSDDCVDEVYYTSRHDPRFVQVRHITKVEGRYGIGFVTAEGNPRFFAFQLTASCGSSAEGSLIVLMEDYLELFTQHLFRLVTTQYKARPSLFVVFDGTQDRLPWHAPLQPDQSELMQDFINEKKPKVEGGADPEITRTALCSVLHQPYENWGEFEVEPRNASTLSFIYERRCRDALARV